MYVYRQLRVDENPAAGIVAKNPEKNYKISAHISRGSTLATQYISASADIHVLEHHWLKEYQKGNKIPRRYVAIDVEKCIESGCTYYGRDTDTTEWGVSAENFWNASQEVVFVGFIPPEAISVIIDEVPGQKPSRMNVITTAYHEVTGLIY